MSNDELIKAIQHWLELFDESMSRDNTPLHQRPLRSAMWLVRDGIAEVSNGSKENYLEEEWFCVIVSAITEWYEVRYGASACSPHKDKISGLVLFHQNPIKIEMPVTISRIEVEGESSWCVFPDKLQEDENILKLFQSEPNINSLSPDEAALFLASIKEIVYWTRSINLNLQTATDLTESAVQMARGILGHIEKAISDVLTLEPASAAVGCWELHLSVEKSFKIYIDQNGRKVTGHCLIDLSKEAEKFGLVVTPTLLLAMPHWKKAIKYRYSEETIPIDKAIEIYRVALQIVFEITQKLKKKISINNASILLRKPRWVGYGLRV